jgi:hypothetical protein
VGITFVLSFKSSMADGLRYKAFEVGEWASLAWSMLVSGTYFFLTDIV